MIGVQREVGEQRASQPTAEVQLLPLQRDRERSEKPEVRPVPPAVVAHLTIVDAQPAFSPTSVGADIVAA